MDSPLAVKVTLAGCIKVHVLQKKATYLNKEGQKKTPSDTLKVTRPYNLQGLSKNLQLGSKF
jgi:hypothetical protein